jgi:hypothetical protein
VTINLDDLDQLQHDVLTGPLTGFQLRDISEALINELRMMREAVTNGY